MDNSTDKRPNAALINREWFTAASDCLPADGLGRVLVAAVRYVLTGEPVKLANPVEVAVFRMVQPALDSDIRAYLERCARNAANARRGVERVAASGTQSQPVGAIPTTTTTTTTTTTPLSLSESKQVIDEDREKWLIWGYFWSIGSRAIKEECNAFWSYYESLGWRNSKGAAIVSRVACARMWRRQFETGTVPDGAVEWYKVAQACPIADYSIWSVFRGVERNETGAVVHLHCTVGYLATLREKMPSIEVELRKALRVSALELRNQ